MSTRKSWQLMVKSKLSPRSGSAALGYVKSIYKMGHKVFKVFFSRNLNAHLNHPPANMENMENMENVYHPQLMENSYHPQLFIAWK